MAIAGGGDPAMRVCIHLRQFTIIKPMHNVDSMVIKTPEQAAAILAAGGDCYIHSVGDAPTRTSQLLREMGLTGPREQDEWKGG